MFISEDVLHYIVQFLSRYDIKVGTHPKAVKELREISDHLIENLYQPDTINVLRRKKTKD